MSMTLRLFSIWTWLWLVLLGSSIAAQEVPRPVLKTVEKIALLPIKGEIDQISAQSLGRRLDQALADGCDAVVLHIDTPGGALDATFSMTEMLKDPTRTPPDLMAWIDDEAWSAGTILAVACPSIACAPRASFGDAAPIQAMPLAGLLEMAPAERAKIEAPLLADVVDSARRNHYDEALVQAFVSVGLELWLLEHVDDGQRICVGRLEYERLFGETPPRDLPILNDEAIASDDAFVPKFEDSIPVQSPEELAELDPLQRQALEAKLSLLPRARELLGPEDKDQWKLVRQITSADRLLALKAEEGRALGLVRHIISDEDDLSRHYGGAEIELYELSTTEKLGRFLTSWPVQLGLIAILLLCVALESFIPGTTVFGLIAVLCGVFLISIPVLVGLAAWWEIVLILLGLGLLAIEIMVAPGLSVPGILGAITLTVGLAAAFTGPGAPIVPQEAIPGTILLFLLLAGGGIVGGRALRHAQQRLLVLEDVVAEGPSHRRVSIAIGSEGILESDAHPVGKARFAEGARDVRARDGFIEAGARIRVVKAGFEPVVEIVES